MLDGAGWPRHAATFYDGAAALADHVRSFVEHDRSAPVLIAAPGLGRGDRGPRVGPR